MNNSPIMKPRSLFVFLLLLAFQAKLSAQELSQLNPKDWIDDLRQLEQLILEEHVHPFWLQDKAGLSEKIYKAGKELSKKELEPEFRLVELMKVIASLKDGHSSLAGGDRYKYLGYVPMTVEWFKEGFMLTRIAKEEEEALGSTLVAIDGMPIEKVLEKLRTVIPHANESRFLKFAPYYLHLPGLLYGLGITKSADQVNLHFDGPGGRSYRFSLNNLGGDGETEMKGIESLLEEVPLHRQQADRSYWFSYLEEEGILYLKYNRVKSDKEESIWAFTERLFEFVDKHKIEKFVVDIRDNGGGNGALSAGLWKGIEENEKINQAGKLFVITGYKTFSAALSFASYLELRTQAIFVGQEACDYLNHPGDNEDYILSKSGIKIRLSKLFHQSSFYLDERQSLYPDHRVLPELASLMKGKDPALEFIKAYKTVKKPLPSQEYSKMIGSYEFSPERRFLIKDRDGILYVEIEGKMQSPLYKNVDGELETEVRGMKLQWSNENAVSITYPDSKTRLLAKLEDPKPTVLGYIYQENLAEAERELLRLKNSCTDCQLYKDHALAGLALEVLYDLRNTLGKDKARELAKEILRMAIRINPEGNEFSKESLKYY